MATLPKRPAKLTTVIVICYVQAVFTLFGAALLLYDVSERIDHNQEVGGAAYFVVFLLLALGVALLVAAIRLPRGAYWTRPLVAVVEGLNILSGVLTLLIAGEDAVMSGILPIMLSAVVLTSLFSRDVTVWFEEMAASREVGQHAANPGPVDFSGPAQGQ